IARDFSVVLVDAAVSLLRVVELVLPNAEPGHDSLDGNVRSLGPLGDVVHDFVARVVGNPNSGESSPSSFFNCTCSCRSSATTSFFCVSLACQAAICRSLPSSRGGRFAAASKAAVPFSKNSFCQP